MLGLALGCGKSEADSGNLAPGGEPLGGSGGGFAMAGAGSAGSQTAGSEGGGTLAGAAGRTTSGGSATGGEPTGETGGMASGGAAARVDCDPTKIRCKRRAPTCTAGEVPSVDGTCYGVCVRIEQCACSNAEQCPEPNQYTCWAQEHCGPFVR